MDMERKNLKLLHIALPWMWVLDAIIVRQMGYQTCYNLDYSYIWKTNAVHFNFSVSPIA